jgi:hypothetical protein
LYAAPATSSSTAREKKREEPTSRRKRLGPEIDLEQAGRNLEELRKRKQQTKIRAAYYKIFDTQAGGRHRIKSASVFNIRFTSLLSGELVDPLKWAFFYPCSDFRR